MKLVRFGAQGQERPGILDADGNVRDASSIVADWNGAAFASGALQRKIDPENLPSVSGPVRFGACVGGTRNFIAVGLNYADHAAESGVKVPSEPVLFNKAPSCIVGPNDDVLLPPGSVKTDWEVELAVVIGQHASYIAENDAPKFIAGYCVCNDVSERAYQLENTGQWTKGKGCPTFGPLGPWLVTPEELGDPQNLRVWLDVNGKRMQDGSTKTMVFQVNFLIAYISRFMALEPGDVITTGTVPGVGLGKKPPLYLKAGDTMELGIEKLGTQRQNVKETPQV
ncbi:MAG TPA: fumarylacetoacetate hydrolase family protein [Acidobacteriaceae bacterium]|nr:fumarylacetoacetate hydrolase family protein [Acidobacteriaceae bacterium]